MKVLTYAASSILLGRAVAETLHLTQSVVGLHLADYEQRGNGIKCKDDAKIDAVLRETGGLMDFASDSLEMCARVCDCRQGCVSFTWVKPTHLDGTPGGFDGSPFWVLPSTVGTSNVGDQGKCSLYTSDCAEGNQEQASAVTYAFAKIIDANSKRDGKPTDVQTQYPRTGDANEQEVTDQVACVLDGVSPVDGYVSLGGGGPLPGVCASGGATAKLTDLDLATGGTVEKCREICDANAECKMFNIANGNSGECKFRKQRCQTSWVTGLSHPYTTYIKGNVTMPPTPAPSPPSIAPVPIPPTTVVSGGEEFSGSIASSTTATALAAALALALVY